MDFSRLKIFWIWKDPEKQMDGCDAAGHVCDNDEVSSILLTKLKSESNPCDTNA